MAETVSPEVTDKEKEVIEHLQGNEPSHSLDIAERTGLSLPEVIMTVSTLRREKDVIEHDIDDGYVLNGSSETYLSQTEEREEASHHKDGRSSERRQEIEIPSSMADYLAVTETRGTTARHEQEMEEKGNETNQITFDSHGSFEPSEEVLEGRSKQERQVIEYLASGGEPKTLTDIRDAPNLTTGKKETISTYSVVRSLVDKGIIDHVTRDAEERELDFPRYRLNPRAITSTDDLHTSDAETDISDRPPENNDGKDTDSILINIPSSLHERFDDAKEGERMAERAFDFWDDSGEAASKHYMSRAKQLHERRKREDGIETSAMDVANRDMDRLNELRDELRGRGGARVDYSTILSTPFYVEEGDIEPPDRSLRHEDRADISFRVSSEVADRLRREKNSEEGTIQSIVSEALEQYLEDISISDVPRGTTPEEETEIINTRINTTHHSKLKSVKTATGVAMSTVTRHAVDDYLS